MRWGNSIFKIKRNNISPRKGKLLIAEPFLRGIYFERSVVLLAEHSKSGSMGFVVNKVTTQLLNDYFTSIVLPQRVPIYLGGPVSMNRLFYIHTCGNLIPGSMPIGNGLFFDGDLDILLRYLSNDKDIASCARFFIGYSGWEQGQLHSEILTNSWLVGNASPEQILQAPGQTLWRQSLERLGEKYKAWANFPVNPRLN
jgi:putative transcriptional regulator